MILKRLVGPSKRNKHLLIVKKLLPSLKRNQTISSNNNSVQRRKSFAAFSRYHYHPLPGHADQIERGLRNLGTNPPPYLITCTQDVPVKVSSDTGMWDN